MKTKIFVVLFAIVYVFLFLRHLPSINPIESRFSIACSNAGGFGEITGKYMTAEVTNGKSPRNWKYTISDPTWDVVSKVICNSGTGTYNPQELYQTVNSSLGSPAVIEARSKPTNYTVEMTSPAYEPSWGEYIMKVLILVVLVGGAFLVRSRVYTE